MKIETKLEIGDATNHGIITGIRACYGFDHGVGSDGRIWYHDDELTVVPPSCDHVGSYPLIFTAPGEVTFERHPYGLHWMHCPKCHETNPGQVGFVGRVGL